MGDDQTVLGVIIAVVGCVGAVLVARVSTPRSREDPPTPAAITGAVATHNGLQVSPEIWRDLVGRISGLEAEVHELKLTIEDVGKDRAQLDQHLRAAMRIVRAQSRTLRRAGLPDELIPPALIPYSID